MFQPTNLPTIFFFFFDKKKLSHATNFHSLISWQIYVEKKRKIAICFQFKISRADRPSLHKMQAKPNIMSFSFSFFLDFKPITQNTWTCQKVICLKILLSTFGHKLIFFFYENFEIFSKFSSSKCSVDGEL